MIKLVNFLLFVEKVISYDKRDIDEGRTPPLIYKICSCIREAFCLSYAIRKNNNVYLYFQKDHVLIKFVGKELRYLGPDERSQALLLEKALKKQTTSNLAVEDKWIKSTPGIYLMRLKNNLSFIQCLNSINLKNLIVINDSLSPDETILGPFNDYPKMKQLKNLEISNDTFFLIPINQSNNVNLIEFLKVLVQIHPSLLEHIRFTPLNNIKAIEDKILYINFQIDKQGTKES